jgi:CubicO group peptidase (beta-lactamase class C family)
MKKSLKWGFVVLGLGLIGGGVFFLNGALPIGTGYSAKYICSQVFLADRDPKAVFDNDVKPTHFLFMLVRPKVDYKNQTVTSKALGVFKPMIAVYRPGCGCTLAVKTDQKTLLDQSAGIQAPDIKRSDALWPAGRTVSIDTLPDTVDKIKLDQVVDQAFTEPGPDTQRNTQAVVIVLGNRIIAERYAPGFDMDTPMLGWSMSKSVTNTLVGILVKDGLLDVTRPAPVGAWQDSGGPKAGITLDMMLRMSTGLAFDEIYAPFKDATNMLYASPSMSDFAAGKPLEAKPNTKWYYSSGTTNIIARVVTEAVGGDLVSFYRFSHERLFKRIRAYSAVIEPDASGVFVGSSYMFATARDWARFGLFLKNDGVWEGERLLPKGWVDYSTTPTPGAPKGEYGAQFWLNAGKQGDRENRRFPTLPTDLYYCGGFNGQIVAVIPSRDAVVVRLGVTHDDSWDHETFIGQVLNAISEE